MQSVRIGSFGSAMPSTRRWAERGCRDAIEAWSRVGYGRFTYFDLVPEMVIPSGKRLHNYGKIHHFLMGKSTISMVIFNSYFDITRGYMKAYVYYPTFRKTVHPSGHDWGCQHGQLLGERCFVEDPSCHLK